MAAGNFEACLAITAKWEGGDVHHKDDPGGLTSRGVTAAAGADYRKRMGLAPKPVTQWSSEEVKRFYRDDYWNGVSAETLEIGVDLATFDAGVNSGRGRARRWLLSSIGGPGKETIKKLCAARLSFVQGLRTWKTFGRGWARRVADIEARAVTMWLNATLQDRIMVRNDLQAEAERAGDVASVQNKGAAGAAGTGTIGTAGTAAASGDVNWWVIGALVALVALAAGALAIRAMQNRERARAYDQVALETAGLAPAA